MNTHIHKFTLEVKTHLSRQQAELAVLHAFCLRNPDNCEFTLNPVDDTTITTPTPPPGYKLVKGIDIRKNLPINGLRCWMKDKWDISIYESSRRMHGDDLDNFYAIPASTPMQDIEAMEQSITDEAKAIVAGDRASDYGDVNKSFARIAKLWSTYTGTTISPWDVVQMMILLKVSRAKTSRKRDTLVDIVGYAECASKLEEPK